MAKVLEFVDSSAVSKISLDDVNNQVSVAFTYKPDDFYVFGCSDLEDFENKVNEVVETKESLGKFIALSRKDGTLYAIQYPC